VKRWSIPGLAVVLAIANGVSPLFTANQHSYLLHAMAQAGYGRLRSGWMAQTTDLTPAFSALIAAGYRLMGQPFLYLAQLTAASILFGSLLLIVRRDLTRAQLVLIAAGLAIVASPPARQFDPFVIPFWGVAEQYVLSTYFQPSDAGVLIVLAVALSLRRTRGALLLAATLSGVAALVHPTYLLPGGLVTLGIAAAEHRETRRPGRALAPLAVYALVCAPMALYVVLNLPMSDAAARILARSRIPHHALPEVWFGLDDVARIAIVAVAVWLHRSERIGLIVGVAAAASLVASVAVAGLGHDRMLLLFPWRVSVVLVPISAALLMAWSIRRIARRSAKNHLSRMVPALAAVVLVYLIGSSIVLSAREIAKPEPFESVPDGMYLIPPDLQDFRLESGQPVLVDEKTHPYRGDEVLEWWRRLRAAQEFYASGTCEPLSRVRARWPGITHVVLSRGASARCVGTQVGRAGSFDIHRVD